MRILIVKLSSIGDVVHALPAAALLKHALPDARISWVVERRASSILKDSPAIDDLIEIDTRGWRKNIFNKPASSGVRGTLGRLRNADDNGGRQNQECPDVAIDFQGLIKSGVVAFASRARNRIGFETAELREKPSRFFLTEQVSTTQFRHVIEKNLALARAAIVRAGGSTAENSNRNDAAYEFPIAVASEDERYVEEAIGAAGNRFAIINPGGGWPTKLWPAERYAQLADWLSSEWDISSFVTYGPGEEELARKVERHARTGAARLLGSSLKQFVALARRAALFVGGDTGPLHLAAASGTPIVGIYGPTSPERNGPFDERDVVVGRDLWCRADCHRRKCWHWQCMDIPTSVVQSAVSARLERVKQGAKVGDDLMAAQSVFDL